MGDRGLDVPVIRLRDLKIDPKELQRLESWGFESELLRGLRIPSLGGEFGSEVAGAEPEPVYEPSALANIQGNIIPGFNKDHQHFLFLRIGDPTSAKRWLVWIEPLLSSMDEVLTFVRAHRSLRFRLGVREPSLRATWVNIAFSYEGIRKLVGRETADAFGDHSFRQGLAARSTFLGDPTSRAHPGHRQQWVVGGPNNEADVLVIAASDDTLDLNHIVTLIRESAGAHRLEVLFEQRGETLPGAFGGHEHFAFKDGVSQPGVRGKVSRLPGDFITPRYLHPSPSDSRDTRPRLFAKPGQPLVWPGQFLLGEPRQNPQDLFASAPPASNFPSWARLGSYLVCRRLRQDVPAFWSFAVSAAEAVGTSPDHLAAMLVGRWPSGAPLMRARFADNAALAGDHLANNHFIFDDDTRPCVLRPLVGYSGDRYDVAREDMLGKVCPHFAHIRKMNPRDSATDLGTPADTLTRMILRRGIPFGPPLVGVENPSEELVRQERGLMFVCYGTSIEHQFEFLTRRWANSSIQPNVGGHDPVIGQQEQRGARIRYLDVPSQGETVRLALEHEWVIPTGGGYFFAPPIEAVVDVLSA